MFVCSCLIVVCGVDKIQVRHTLKTVVTDNFNVFGSPSD